MYSASYVSTMSFKIMSNFLRKRFEEIEFDNLNHVYLLTEVNF